MSRLPRRDRGLGPTLLTPVVRITFGTWILTTVYTMLHDQYIVRIAPAHFTEGHAAVSGVTDPAAQAAILAFGAALLPGFAFGLALAITCREGSWPVIGVGRALVSVVAALGATEVASVLVGGVTAITGTSPFGAGWFPPDPKRAVVVAQTIQLTAYIAGGLTAAATLSWHGSRRRIASRLPPTGADQ